MKNYGYVNSWSKTPEEVARCKKLGHKLVCERTDICVREYSCPICDYKYQVDSSD